MTTHPTNYKSASKYDDEATKKQAFDAAATEHGCTWPTCYIDKCVLDGFDHTNEEHLRMSKVAWNTSPVGFKARVAAASAADCASCATLTAKLEDSARTLTEVRTELHEVHSGILPHEDTAFTEYVEHVIEVHLARERSVHSIAIEKMSDEIWEAKTALVRAEGANAAERELWREERTSATAHHLTERRQSTARMAELEKAILQENALLGAILRKFNISHADVRAISAEMSAPAEAAGRVPHASSAEESTDSPTSTNDTIPAGHTTFSWGTVYAGRRADGPESVQWPLGIPGQPF